MRARIRSLSRLLFLTLAVSAGATDQGVMVWGALVRATKEPVTTEESGLDSKLERRLKKAFPHPGFQLLGEHSQTVHHEVATFIVPSEEFYFKVDSRGRVAHGLALHLQLWRREKVLVKSDVILRTGSPLILTGPVWGDDQLYLVLRLEQ